MVLRHGSMGEVNTHLVLAYFRDHPRTTRPEIAAALGLSPASVSRIITKLIARGIVAESEGRSVSGGRPRTVLTLDVTSAHVVGIDLGGTKCHGVMATLDGEILAEKHVTVADAGSAFAALETVWQQIRSVVRERGSDPAALAVGVPAVIDPQTGLAGRGPNIGWERFDVVSRVREFGVPFLVDNDVNLAAIAEGEVGQAVGSRDYAVISIGTGLGGAVVAGGQLIRGRNNAAGEVGALLPSTSMLDDPRVATVGGLESILSGRAIARHAQRLVDTDTDALEELGHQPTVREVIEAGLLGRPHSARLVDDVVRALAQAVVAVSAVTDPEIVVIDGSVGRALAPRMDEVAELVSRHIATPPRLRISGLSPNSTVRGALSGALKTFWASLAPAIIETLTLDGSAIA